jgi:hypothetical protein
MGASPSSSSSHDAFDAIYAEMRAITRARPFPKERAEALLEKARRQADVPELKAEACRNSFRKPAKGGEGKEPGVESFRRRFFALLEARVGVEVGKANLPGFVRTLGMSRGGLCTEKVTGMRRGWPRRGQSKNPFLQVLMSVTSASLSACFAHNDLHLNNVLLQNTARPTEHVYTMRFPGNSVTYSFRDEGIRSLICDFGCSGIVVGEGRRARWYRAQRHPVLGGGGGSRCSPVHDILYFMARADLASREEVFPVKRVLGAVGFLSPSLVALYTAYRLAVSEMLQDPADRARWNVVKRTGDRVDSLVTGERAQRVVEAILLRILDDRKAVKAKGAYGFRLHVPFLSAESQAAEEIARSIARVGVRPRVPTFLREKLGETSIDEFLATREATEMETLTGRGGGETVIHNPSSIIVKRFTNERLGLQETLVTSVVQKMADELYDAGDAAAYHFMTYLGWKKKRQGLELRLLRIGQPLGSALSRIRSRGAARSVICQVLLAIMTAHLAPGYRFSHLDLHIGNVTIQDKKWPASEERNYKTLGFRVGGSETESLRAVIIDYGHASVNWKGVRYGHGGFKQGVVNSQSTDYAIDFFRFLYVLSMQNGSAALRQEARWFLREWTGMGVREIVSKIKRSHTVKGEAHGVYLSYTRFVSEWRETKNPAERETDAAKRALCRRLAQYAWGPRVREEDEATRSRSKAQTADRAPGRERQPQPSWHTCVQILPGGHRVRTYFYDAAERR